MHRHDYDHANLKALCGQGRLGRAHGDIGQLCL